MSNWIVFQASVKPHIPGKLGTTYLDTSFVFKFFSCTVSDGEGDRISGTRIFLKDGSNLYTLLPAEELLEMLRPRRTERDVTMREKRRNAVSGRPH